METIDSAQNIITLTSIEMGDTARGSVHSETITSHRLDISHGSSFHSMISKSLYQEEKKLNQLMFQEQIQNNLRVNAAEGNITSSGGVEFITNAD